MNIHLKCSSYESCSQDPCDPLEPLHCNSIYYIISYSSLMPTLFSLLYFIGRSIIFRVQLNFYIYIYTHLTTSLQYIYTNIVDRSNTKIYTRTFFFKYIHGRRYFNLRVLYVYRKKKTIELRRRLTYFISLVHWDIIGIQSVSIQVQLWTICIIRKTLNP